MRAWTPFFCVLVLAAFAGAGVIIGRASRDDFLMPGVELHEYHAQDYAWPSLEWKGIEARDDGVAVMVRVPDRIIDSIRLSAKVRVEMPRIAAKQFRLVEAKVYPEHDATPQDEPEYIRFGFSDGAFIGYWTPKAYAGDREIRLMFHTKDHSTHEFIRLINSHSRETFRVSVMD